MHAVNHAVAIKNMVFLNVRDVIGIWTSAQKITGYIVGYFANHLHVFCSDFIVNGLVVLFQLGFVGTLVSATVITFS